MLRNNATDAGSARDASGVASSPPSNFMAFFPASTITTALQSRSVARWFSENEMPAPSLHLPFERPGEDILAARPIERQRALDEIKRCLELCDLMPLRYAVLHLGSPARSSIPSLSIMPTRPLRSFNRLPESASCWKHSQTTSRHSNGSAEFRNAAQIPNMGICYDTGHGEMDGQARRHSSERQQRRR